MTATKKIDQAFYILTTYTVLKGVFVGIRTYAPEGSMKFAQSPSRGVFLEVGDFNIMVKTATKMNEQGEWVQVTKFLLTFETSHNKFRSLGLFDAPELIEFIKIYYCTPSLEAGNLPETDFDRDDLRYLGELTGQDFIGYAPGDKVLYVPNHATGPEDSICERGVVSSVEGEIGSQKVWVKYGSGDTGQLTPVKNLRRV